MMWDRTKRGVGTGGGAGREIKRGRGKSVEKALCKEE
jgi:hypothetical protein